uniref:HDNR domain-containing protein n=2 Tax=Panagrellus redivivus TaxID=6233 RepID=A0A7E4ZTY5_PANRE
MAHFLEDSLDRGPIGTISRTFAGRPNQSKPSLRPPLRTRVGQSGNAPTHMNATCRTASPKVKDTPISAGTKSTLTPNANMTEILDSNHFQSFKNDYQTYHQVYGTWPHKTHYFLAKEGKQPKNHYVNLQRPSNTTDNLGRQNDGRGLPHKTVVTKTTTHVANPKKAMIRFPLVHDL